MGLEERCGAQPRMQGEGGTAVQLGRAGQRPGRLGLRGGGSVFHPRTAMIEASEGCGCVWNACTPCKEAEPRATRGENGAVSDSSHLLAPESPSSGLFPSAWDVSIAERAELCPLPLGRSPLWLRAPGIYC